MNESEKVIEEELKKSKILPKELKDYLDEVSFINNLKAITIMFYFVVINYAYLMSSNKEFLDNLKYFSMIGAVITVFLFEYSYRKSNKVICILALESLAATIITAYIPYIYLFGSVVARKLVMLLPLFYALYYVIKSTVMFIIKTKKYEMENISDVKDLLNDDEYDGGYLDDEDSSKLIEKRKQEEAIIKEIKKKKKEEAKKKEEENKTDEEVNIDD